MKNLVEEARTCHAEHTTHGKFIQRLADRIEELEANLAKAVEIALEECPFRDGTGGYEDWWHERRTTLAELEPKP
jgi:hypothetical protein